MQRDEAAVWWRCGGGAAAALAAMAVLWRRTTVLRGRRGVDGALAAGAAAVCVDAAAGLAVVVLWR